jgi:hypothetical protein
MAAGAVAGGANKLKRKKIHPSRQGRLRWWRKVDYGRRRVSRHRGVVASSPRQRAASVHPYWLALKPCFDGFT